MLLRQILDEIFALGILHKTEDLKVMELKDFSPIFIYFAFKRPCLMASTSASLQGPTQECFMFASAFTFTFQGLFKKAPAGRSFHQTFSASLSKALKGMQFYLPTQIQPASENI